MVKKGLNRIEKELDIVRFIRNKMMLNTVFQVLFTKPELFLLRNQAKFALKGNHQTTTFADHVSIDSESSDLEREFEETDVQLRSQFFDQLMKNASINRKSDSVNWSDLVELKSKPIKYRQPISMQETNRKNIRLNNDRNSEFKSND